MNEFYKLKQTNLESIFIFVFSCVVIISARLYYGWGYDEYGAVISHLELDDFRFLNVYKEKLIGIGFHEWIVSYLLMPTLSIVIVPLRWTYALGISPLYAIARFEMLSWDQIRMLITFFHVVTVGVGLRLIILSIFPGQKRMIFLISILSVALFSHPFIYWMGTFTSYSLHTLCFGLLILSESRKRNWDNNIVGKTSFARSIIILSNYQYLPILFVIGLHEVITKKIVFFMDKSYQNWIIPAIIGCVSIYVILMRLNFIGSELSPELNFDQATRYLIPYDADFDSTINSLQFFFSRIIDIGNYFFFTEGQAEYFRSETFTEISIVSASIIFLFLGLIAVICLRSENLRNSKFLHVFQLSMSVLAVQMLLYLFNIVPTSPTRHSLIMLWPFISTVAILVLTLAKNKKSEFFLLVGTLFLFSASAYSYYLGFDNSQKKNISQKVTSCLITDHVAPLVLEPCFLQPILQNRTTNFIYSCGSFDVDKIPESAVKIGLLTTEEWTNDSAKELLSRYSNKAWTRNKLSEDVLKDCLSESSILEHEIHTNVEIYELKE